MQRGLSDPLAAVKVVNQHLQVIHDKKLHVRTSSDFAAFRTARLEMRGDLPSPMFDDTIGDLSSKAFWVSMHNEEGDIKCIQACRLDYIDTSLAEWVVGWMSGLYLKRNQLMVPEFLEPPKESRSRDVRGWVVYHGEMWIDREYRGLDNIFDDMASIVVFLAYIKWQPDAVWGLVSTHMAMRGQGNRMSYPRVERSFLRWNVAAQGIPSNEWLVLSERKDLDLLVSELSVMGGIFRER